MELRGADYRVGIGGWEHEVLDRCFYPAGCAGSEEKLAFTARHFDLTEVRATFWDDGITADDARRWAAAAAGNRRFQFAVKLHRSFTHRRELRPQAARAVRAVLQELARQNRLAALLVQFPYAFTNTGAGRFHLGRLAELFRGFPIQVEFRHESWSGSETRRLLEDLALSSVSADLPRVGRFLAFGTAAAGETAYLRLHGRNEKGWLHNGLDARYDYLYNAREMQEIRRRALALGERRRTVYVAWNNTTGGKAVANALQMAAALRGGEPVAVPPAALSAFPFLRQVAASAEEAPLFAVDGAVLRAAM